MFVEDQSPKANINMQYDDHPFKWKEKKSKQTKWVTLVTKLGHKLSKWF